MLSLLLDEHISPVVAEQARRKFPGIQITPLKDWHAERFLGLSDVVLLSAAAKERLTLVSYDQRTIRPLLKTWLEQAISHGGIIFIDAKTIAPQNFGALIKSIGLLWRSQRHAPWKNRVIFLQKQS